MSEREMRTTAVCWRDTAQSSSSPSTTDWAYSVRLFLAVYTQFAQVFWPVSRNKFTPPHFVTRGHFISKYFELLNIYSAIQSNLMFTNVNCHTYVPHSAVDISSGSVTGVEQVTLFRGSKYFLTLTMHRKLYLTIEYVCACRTNRHFASVSFRGAQCLRRIWSAQQYVIYKHYVAAADTPMRRR